MSQRRMVAQQLGQFLQSHYLGGAPSSKMTLGYTWSKKLESGPRVCNYLQLHQGLLDKNQYTKVQHGARWGYCPHIFSTMAESIAKTNENHAYKNADLKKK